jgi:hypothetical protein
MVGTLRLYPYLAIAGAAALVVAARALLRRKRKTPEQLERERRTRISVSGRITDGTVIDVNQIQLNGNGETQLLIYKYDVAGVSYEASQDITHLRHLVDIHSCRLGLQASIKYDPENPGNSIVVSEMWTGLRL